MHLKDYKKPSCAIITGAGFIFIGSAYAGAQADKQLVVVTKNLLDEGQHTVVS